MNKFKKQQFISQKQLPTGRWTFQVQINKDGIIDRKNFSEKEYGSARAAYDAAIVYRDEVLNNIRNEKYNKKTNKTVLDCFNESFELFPLRVETIKKHKGMFNKYINIDYKIQDLNSFIIQKSLNNMIEIASDDTIQRVFLIWKRIIKTAIINNYINEDYTLKIQCPKSHYISKRHTKNQTSFEELEEVIKLIKNSNYKDKDIIINILLTLYYTGLRPGEVLALNKEDIDLKNNILYVNKELGSSLSQFGVIRDTKTPLSNRIIPISKQLNKILKNQFKLIKNNIVFNKEGNYYSSTELGNRIRILCRKNNIDFYMYQLRHLFSSNLINLGIDARTHQELMGHASYSMSVNYASSNLDKKKKILDEL